MPLEVWHQLLGRPVLVPLYHIVSDQPVIHVRHLYRYRNVAEFTAELHYLLRHYAPVGLETLVEVAAGRYNLRRPSFHLTFDDGFREVHEVIAPILVREGVPASIFIATSFLDGAGLTHHNRISVLVESLARGVSPRSRDAVAQLLGPDLRGLSLEKRLLATPYSEAELLNRIAAVVEVDFSEYIRTTRPHLTCDELMDLVKQGFDIGAHSCDHLLYADLPPEEQWRQTIESVAFVSSRFGSKIRSFAFPHNDERIGPAFFERVFSEGHLDITFGTNGLRRHFHPRNLERVVMEVEGFTPSAIIHKAYADSLFPSPSAPAKPNRST